MASPQSAPNPYNVVKKPIDYSKPESSTVMTYHGFSIVVNGKIIGRVKEWNPQAYGREGNHIYELSHETWGRPVDYVPGRVEEFQISFGRVELWDQELEIALGFSSVWEDLMDQNYPISIYEYLYKGTSLYRVWLYRGCWFKSKQMNSYDATGDGIVSVECTIAYVRRERLV